MSAIHEVADLIRAGDEFQQERSKTFRFALTNARPILPLGILNKSTLSGDHTDSNWHPDKLLSWNNDLQVDLLDNKPELNVGVLFGDNLIDIDIDSTDAFLVAALKHYLAKFPTPYKWGRSGKPNSHIAYVLKDPFDRALHARAIKALAEYKELSIELRGGESKSNFFSMMPGSIHESGQLVRWDKGYDPKETPAPLGDVRPLIQALRRSVAASLLARHCIEGSRHYFFLSLIGTLVRMWKQAEDAECPEAAMNQEEALDFFKLVQTLAGDTDHRVESFNTTWKKFMDDPTTPISGGTKLAEIIGEMGVLVRNLVYKLLVDDEGFEQAEAALERFLMLRTPNAGILDLETLKPHIKITGAMKQEDLNMLFTSYKVPFGNASVPLPAFLRTSSQVTKAVGLELRPDQPPRTIFKVVHTEEEHGYSDESLFVNAWVGFKYHPYSAAITGTLDDQVRPFLNYVWEVIADEIPERYTWVLSWLADIFQDPANKPGTLLALTGPQGSGKTMLGEIVGKIIGEAHYGKIGSIEDLTKEFNSRVHYKLFVQADETASTQKTSIARDLKELVTGLYQTIVYKGREGILSYNPARYFFTSNNSGDALRVEAGYERRYTILETSHKRVGDLQYWKDFVDWWEQSKNLRLIHRYLKEFKYNKTIIRKALQTTEKKQHQMNSIPPVIQWALQRASEGYPITAKSHEYSYQAYKSDVVKVGTQWRVSPAPTHVDRMEWPNLVELQALTDDFNRWVRDQNIRQLQSHTAVSKFLSDLRGGGRMEYNSITALRAGVKVRPKLMRFPTREEYVTGIKRMYPALSAEVDRIVKDGEDTEVVGEDDTGEF